MDGDVNCGMQKWLWMIRLKIYDVIILAGAAHAFLIHKIMCIFLLMSVCLSGA